MSFSTLRALETCPLRWSLGRSRYPAIGAEAGYPARAGTKTLVGQVVHEALERITRAVASAGAGQAQSGTGVVAALKSLGGYTQVLANVIDELAPVLAANPRAVRQGRDVIQELRDQLPELRARTQTTIAQSAASLVGVVPSGATGVERPPEAVPRGGALSTGVHAEVPLNHRSADWYGRADLLRLEGDTCEITDFKTGLPKDDHHLQLRAYAWLWFNDRARNPQRVRATSLRLIYSGGAVLVDAPSPAELKNLEEELGARSEAARTQLASTPPPARPSREACALCDVRQLCPEYWTVETQAMLYATAPQEARDAEVQLLSRQGEWSWRGQIVACVTLPVGSKAIVRTRPQDGSFLPVLEASRQVRLVGARIDEPSEDDGGTAVANLVRSSEVFVVR